MTDRGWRNIIAGGALRKERPQMLGAARKAQKDTRRTAGTRLYIVDLVMGKNE